MVEALMIAAIVAGVGAIGFMLIRAKQHAKPTLVLVGGRKVAQVWEFSRGHLTRIDAPELPEDLLITPAALTGSTPGVDHRIGHPDFDTRFRIQLGALGMAWLDATARQDLLGLAPLLKVFEAHDIRCGPKSVTVEGRAVTVESERRPGTEDLQRLVERVERFAVRDPRESLERIATSDELIPVRARALVTLVAAFPDDEVWAKVASLTTSDVPLLRAVALLLAGRDGLEEAVAACGSEGRWHALDLTAAVGRDVQLAEAIRATATPPFVKPVWAQACQVARAHPSAAVAQAIADTAGRLAGASDGSFVADFAIVALTGSDDPATRAQLEPLVALAGRRRKDAQEWLASH